VPEALPGRSLWGGIFVQGTEIIDVVVLALYCSKIVDRFKAYICGMEEIEFIINGEFIELIGLLKVMGIAQTGGHAKMIVEDEKVLRNGKLEVRKRAKLVSGDVIEVGREVRIVLK
jgi:ribosome-associated protein